jgi:hypothetical protein
MKILLEDRVNGGRVVTVWTGVDYETEVWDSTGIIDTIRYDQMSRAVVGHRDAVRRLAGHLENEDRAEG